MEIYTLSFFEKNMDFFVNQALNEKIFVYPTDTIYGIWSIVNKNTIKKIYEIKKRNLHKPLSIIAPNIEWIKNFFEVPKNFDKILNNALKSYHWITLLLKKKNGDFLSEISNTNFVWVRILKNHFQSFVDRLWQPFITTSVNISWEKNITKIIEIWPEIWKKIDIIINNWILENPPSVLIDIYKNNITKR